MFSRHGWSKFGRRAQNTIERGRVSRTLWPPGAGTHRLMREFGDALVCVRHREDPAGLRRVVTVELVVGPVAARAGQRRLRDRAWYPVALGATERTLKAQLRGLGAHWDPAHGFWYARGDSIRQLGLEDRIAMQGDKGKARAGHPHHDRTYKI